LLYKHDMFTMYRSGDIFVCIFMRFSEHEILQFPCMVQMVHNDTLIVHRDIEDEYHFIYVCEKYEDIRKMYGKAHNRRHPSAFKLIQLLSVQCGSLK
jgi:hypothetical protein